MIKKEPVHIQMFLNIVIQCDIMIQNILEHICHIMLRHRVSTVAGRTQPKSTIRTY